LASGVFEAPDKPTVHVEHQDLDAAAGAQRVRDFVDGLNGFGRADAIAFADALGAGPHL
jgi:hypothetical protein